MDKLELLFNNLDKDVESVLITSDVNRRYFSGMKSTAGYILAFPEKAYLLIDFRYIEKARNTVKNCEVILLYNIKQQLAELLNKHNAKVVSIESDTVTLTNLNQFKQWLEGFEIDTSSKLSDAITKLRSVKSSEEIEKITKAQRIAEKAFDHVLNFIKPGVTEKDIALELNFYMLKNGAEALSFDTIALTGKNTSLPHGVPSDTPVKSGDFVLMDYGAVYDGYHSDMTRTICVGKPTEEMEYVYSIVLQAQEEALKNVKAGIIGKELDSFARDVILLAGYGDNFGHGVGHGVGMEIHEYPNASPAFDKPIEENTIVTIEPGIYLPDNFGVRIEDFVVVKKDSYENITKCAKNLICI